jgi:hypothetical protein
MPITTTPSGGPQGEFSTYTPIYAQTLSSAAASITFSNIPTTFTDLVIVCGSLKYVTGDDDAFVRFNGDTGSNYSWTQLNGNGVTPSSNRGSSTSGIRSINGMSTTNVGTAIINVQNYSNSTTYKTTVSRHSTAFAGAFAGLWRNTAAITSVTIINLGAGGFATGSTFTLYGIKAAAPAPKATGGDVITTDGTYWYHAFKTTGLFDVKQPITANILLIGGGGSGGGNLSGAGGAGGLIELTSQSLSLSTYTVAVGAGAPTNISGNGGNGNISQLGSLTAALGGGGGNSINSATQAAGATSGLVGSGGGGSYGNNAAGLGTSGQGNNGGSVPGHPAQCGGGGGGKGSVGSNGSGFNGGAGGSGVNTYSTWAAATGTGVSGFYAGGGGGGGDTNPGAGGSGGGGAGASTSDGFPGIVNTGSGGGGSRQLGSTRYGGAGGSGLVIVRYPV